MTTVVISQPMLFPWVGLLESIRLADVYVHHENIQWSKSGFVHRVQLRTAQGQLWMGIPLKKSAVDVKIEDLEAADDKWKRRHLALLSEHYRRARHFDEMIAFVEHVYSVDYPSLGEFLMGQLEHTIEFLDLNPKLRIERVGPLGLDSAGSPRVLSIVKAFEGTRYVTGHGAKNYLDHEEFGRNGVSVDYMDYAMTPYEQLHAPYIPYVSVLDLIANVGRDNALRYFAPQTVDWREFVSR